MGPQVLRSTQYYWRRLISGTKDVEPQLRWRNHLISEIMWNLVNCPGGTKCARTSKFWILLTVSCHLGEISLENIRRRCFNSLSEVNINMYGLDIILGRLLHQNIKYIETKHMATLFDNWLHQRTLARSWFVKSRSMSAVFMHLWVNL